MKTRGFYMPLKDCSIREVVSKGEDTEGAFRGNGFPPSFSRMARPMPIDLRSNPSPSLPPEFEEKTLAHNGQMV